MTTPTLSSKSPDVDSKTELPPFSFSKKPIDQYCTLKGRNLLYATSSSLGTVPSYHSNISDIIPSISRKNTASTTSTVSTSQLTNADPKFNDMDYDDQIRFPQMNNLNYYTYGAKDKERKLSTSGSVQSSLSVDKEVPKKEIAGDKVASKYTPATFDLSQPLRRFSLPFNKDNSTESINLKRTLDDDTEENLQLLKEYILNNYIYEKNLEQAKLNHIISNFLNKETEEKPAKNTNSQHPFYQPGSTRIKNLCPIGLSKKMTSVKEQQTINTSLITSFYQMKKPLSTPAVLRPPVTASTLNDTPEGDDGNKDEYNVNSVYTITSPIASVGFEGEYCDDSANLSLSPERQVQYEKIFNVEPTHEHWMSNNVTNHCMQCFKTFGSSILSLVYLFFDEKLKKDQDTDSISSTGSDSGTSSSNSSSTSLSRRHHCRFCGLIICSNCLIQSDGDEAQKTGLTNGILMDGGARFVIPIARNLKTPSVGAIEPHNYKLFKVCRKCGDTYKKLVGDLNNGGAGAEGPKMGRMVSEARFDGLPFVYIENPYLERRRRGVVLEEEQDFADHLQRHQQGHGAQAYSRKNSANEVPNDWIWSSF